MPPKEAIYSTGMTACHRALERCTHRWFDHFEPPDAKTTPSTPYDAAKITPFTLTDDDLSCTCPSSSLIFGPVLDTSGTHPGHVLKIGHFADQKEGHMTGIKGQLGDCPQ